MVFVWARGHGGDGDGVSKRLRIISKAQQPCDLSNAASKRRIHEKGIMFRGGQILNAEECLDTCSAPI